MAIETRIPPVDEYTGNFSRDLTPEVFTEQRTIRLNEESTRIPQQNDQAVAINQVAEEMNEVINGFNTAVDKAAYKGIWDSNYASGSGYDLGDNVVYLVGDIYSQYISNKDFNTSEPTTNDDWYLATKSASNFIDNTIILSENIIIPADNTFKYEKALDFNGFSITFSSDSRIRQEG